MTRIRLQQRRENVAKQIEDRKTQIRTMQQDIIFDHWANGNYRIAERLACEITNIASEISVLELQLRELEEA